VKSARERLDIVNAYAELGSYRAAAELCGTTHKTVRRIIQRHRAGTLGQRARSPRRARNTDAVTDLIAGRIKQTDGRISAKRLLPEARAAGYQGSARNFRRAVAPIRADWRPAHLAALAAHPGRASGDRLGHRGGPAGVLCGVGLEPLAVRALCP
jgi:capsid protein